MPEQIVLVDENGIQIGIGEKMKMHREGRLHRAFSVFVFNSQNQLMLQKRAKTKYHSGGLWTNTCCSHPKPGEPQEIAAHRRLMEEMGFDCELKEIFSFIYWVEFDGNLFEHEYDHVFVGHYDETPTPNPEEVENWKWVDGEALKQDIQKNPEHYTHWFKIAVDRVIENYHHHLFT